jgi:vesicle-associated membrane protein 7
MIFAETSDALAYVLFTAPSYPERVAKQLVDKHARAVESMQGDGTFVPQQGAAQTGTARKAYASLCTTLGNDYAAGDRVASVMREVESVKGVMSDNINHAMSNLESTEALNNATEEMRAQSSMFNKQAKTAKNKMWWKNMKLNLVVGLIAVAIIGYIVHSVWPSDDGDDGN